MRETNEQAEAQVPGQETPPSNAEDGADVDFASEPKEAQGQRDTDAEAAQTTEADLDQADKADGANEAADSGEAGQFDAAAAAAIEQYKRLADEQQQRYLRTQADFDNFRRRTLKEKEELSQYASMKLITQLLPVVDNLERALAAAKSSEDGESFSKGVEMIFRQLEQVLQQEGLQAMNPVGEPFNPDYHQAIMQVESDEYEEGIVVEEIQKGYILKEKVLRPAMVKVSG